MDLLESIQRVHASELVFGERFYQQLAAKHPEVTPFFAGVDMRRQAIIFTMQLAVVGAYYQRRSPTSQQYLQVLGTQHHRRGIPKEAYATFRDCLLGELRQFHGDDWSDELEQQWRAAMDEVTSKMWEGYEERFHV